MSRSMAAVVLCFVLCMFVFSACSGALEGWVEFAHLQQVDNQHPLASPDPHITCCQMILLTTSGLRLS